MALAKVVINQTGAIREFEKPEVCEAIKVANANRWTVALSPTEWDERKARLKKEYEERSNAPVPGKEQQEEKIRIICCSASPKADFYYEHFLNEGNPALKESASQFNDALLDEQAKEIKCIKEKNLRLGKEIARLNKNIYKKNMKIEELRKESSRHLRGKVKMFGENVDLEQMLKDKNAVLSDVAEELRLSKIREKNLTEVSQKYMKENEELKKKVADKVVEKIDDVQALKNAESALAWKDRVIYYKDMAIAYNEKEIADLGKELKAKHKKYVWYKGAYEAAQQILNTIADYAAKHPDKKFSDQMVEDCADSVKPEAKREKLSSEKITEIEKKVSDLFKQRDKEIADFMFVKSELFGGSDIFDQMKAQAFCEARYALLNSNFLIK